MNAAQRDGERRLVWHAGRVVLALNLAYAAVTLGGFLSLPHAEAPIADPWFAAMEWLIILLTAPVLVFLWALGRVAGVGRGWSIAAVVLAGMTFALSVALHLALLAISRDDPRVAAGGPLSFVWPSAAYAIDILAWDGFFGAALLCCAMALRALPGMKSARLTFLAAGLLALAGMAGPALDAMSLRNIGVVGYAVLFPVAVWLVLRALERGDGA
jgi:hypothetical protein